MFKKILLYSISLTLLGACSGSDDAQDIINGITIPGPGAVVTKSITPQIVAGDVPGIPAGSTYYGKQTFNLDEDVIFNLKEETDHKVFDLQYSSPTDIEILITHFSSSPEDECANKSENLSWMQVTATGEVLSEETISLQDPVIAYAGGRYLLRVTYSQTSQCSQLSAHFTFTKFNQ